MTNLERDKLTVPMHEYEALQAQIHEVCEKGERLAALHITELQARVAALRAALERSAFQHEGGIAEGTHMVGCPGCIIIRDALAASPSDALETVREGMRALSRGDHTAGHVSCSGCKRAKAALAAMRGMFGEPR